MKRCVFHRWGRILAGLSAVPMLLIQPAAWAGGPIRFGVRSPVHAVAKAINKLELDLEQTGTVVAKAPDVWGQARLTQHREEFERQMAAQLTAFTANLNGEIARTDQAFLAQAIALSAVLNESKQSGSSDPSVVPAINLSTVTGMVSGITGVSPTDPPSNPNNVNAPAVDGNFTVVRAQPFQNLSTTFGSNTAITLEPEVLLDQRKRFLNHLHEIRRINEGDDTADSPGYSLNLVRIPVSILPGSKTREGYGAEITVTATPHLTPELLPSTFRTLVINDLVEQLSFPIVKYLETMWPYLLEVELAEEQVREERARTQVQQTPEALVVTTSDASLKRVALLQRRLVMAAENLEAAISSGQRTRRARFALPPSQLIEVYGGEELYLVAKNIFGRRDRKRCNWGAFLPEVQGYLREELHASYELLTHRRTLGPSDPSLGGGACETTLWDWIDPALGQQIRSSLQPSRPGGLADRIPASRAAFFRTVHGSPTFASTDLSQPPGPDLQCGTGADSKCTAWNVTEALAWAVIVESILLNDRLNEDLQRVAQDPNCGCHPTGCYQFYGPNPPPEAREAFIDYVRCRWPIHVFALDPEIQQQNIADSLSIRREMQVAIALAFTSRRANAQSLTRYMRRLETDMRTIALNNTAVGFGHGENTFGWRFFPRFQTPPLEGNMTVVTRDLLLGGPDREAMLRRQRLESGTRECVALVVMPSFVKHVQFETRSDWFKLTNSCLCHCQEFRPKMTYVMDWSEDIRAMQDAMDACLAEQDRYRAGDVPRMMARVEQLSQALPMQTLYSQVPYENTLGGFEMFSSGVTDLSPELAGFYGVPGIDIAKETQLFVVGNHFSVHDTRVMAGNRMCQVRMLSREVMQVTVPPGVQVHKRRQMAPPLGGSAATAAPCPQCPTVAVDTSTPVPLFPDQRVPKPTSDPLCPVLENPCCNTEYVELVLATPYGIAAPLEVPVVRSVCPDPQLGWNLAATPYEITYRYKYDATAKTLTIDDKDIYLTGDHRLAIGLPASVMVLDSTLTKVSLSLAAATGGVAPLADLDINTLRFNQAKREYAIEGNNFVNFHKDLKAKVQALVYGDSKSPPPGELYLSVTAVVFPDANSSYAVSGEVPFRITFVPKP